MPKGPNGEKRPSDVIGNAVKIVRIATGEDGHRCGYGATPKDGVSVRVSSGDCIGSKKTPVTGNPDAGYVGAS
jgi:hypothetical protein